MSLLRTMTSFCCTLRLCPLFGLFVLVLLITSLNLFDYVFLSTQKLAANIDPESRASASFNDSEGSWKSRLPPASPQFMNRYQQSTTGHPQQLNRDQPSDAKLGSEPVPANGSTKRLEASGERLTQSQGKLLLENLEQHGPNCGNFRFTSSDKKVQLFKPILHGRDLCILLETVDAFATALTKDRVPFFMYSGTLLGSWRHHDVVPWDDDVDFAVPYDQRMEVFRSLLRLSPKFILDVRQKVRWKLYEVSGHPTHMTWKYPFVDISFYSRIGGNITDTDSSIFPKFTFPIDWIFPLVHRPFHGRWLPAPRLTEKTLRATYDLKSCNTGAYDHKQETSIKSFTMDCQALHGVLPFVHREQVRTERSKGCNETLVQGGRVLSYHFFKGEEC